MSLELSAASGYISRPRLLWVIFTFSRVPAFSRFATGISRKIGASLMRRLLPSRFELAIFATLAVLCAAFVHAFAPGTSDLRFAGLAFPIFLLAAVMGLRKSPQWANDSDDRNVDPEA